jgi:hypothetical protein
VGEVGKSLVRFAQERLDPFVIHHLGTVDLGCEHEAFGVYQQVSLATFDLLAPVLTPGFPAYCGGLYRLRIHHARAGLKGSLFKRTRSCSRMARLIFSQVPSIRQALK